MVNKQVAQGEAHKSLKFSKFKTCGTIKLKPYESYEINIVAKFHISMSTHYGYRAFPCYWDYPCNFIFCELWPTEVSNHVTLDHQIIDFFFATFRVFSLPEKNSTTIFFFDGNLNSLLFLDS